MSKIIKIKSTFSLSFYLFITIICTLSCSQKSGKQKIEIAFYNCENFFDCKHDEGKEDEEFTPGGKYHYTQNIYEHKLHNIATVIQSMSESGKLAIVGMAEVENKGVLNDLVAQPEISRYNYSYELIDGPDPRGINVAIIYNPSYFKLLHAESLNVQLNQQTDQLKGKLATRDILHVYGILNTDTVHVFVNHWPSRRGGEDESAPKREIAATVERNVINNLINKDPEAKIVVMGDFNDNPTDNSLLSTLDAKGEQSEVSGKDLYNPWTAIYKGGGGTEEYRHRWNLFDQIILSYGFLHNKNHKLGYEKAEIYKPDFIIDHYKGHEGTPHRSFVGTHWINGYSDHFPVILSLN